VRPTPGNDQHGSGAAFSKAAHRGIAALGTLIVPAVGVLGAVLMLGERRSRPYRGTARFRLRFHSNARRFPACRMAVLSS
jgi:hypothetical protein